MNSRSRSMSGTNRDRFFKSARLLKALGHPLRLVIASGLRNEPCTQTYMAEMMGIPQSTVAQHLKVLRSEGMIKSQRKGIEVVFSLADPSVGMILDTLFRKAGKRKGTAYTWKELSRLEKDRRMFGF